MQPGDCKQVEDGSNNGGENELTMVDEGMGLSIAIMGEHKSCCRSLRRKLSV